MGELVDLVRLAVAPVLEELRRGPRVIDLVEVHVVRLVEPVPAQQHGRHEDEQDDQQVQPVEAAAGLAHRAARCGRAGRWSTRSAGREPATNLVGQHDRLGRSRRLDGHPVGEPDRRRTASARPRQRGARRATRRRRHRRALGPARPAPSRRLERGAPGRSCHATNTNTPALSSALAMIPSGCRNSSPSGSVRGWASRRARRSGRRAG